ILKDSKASLLIAARRFSEQVEQLGQSETGLKQVLWVGEGDASEVFEGMDYEDALSGQSSSSLPDLDISDEAVAHLYYTSGTTGLPKGVMLTHKNVSTHALGTIAELNLADRDVWIHVAPMFHLADAWATFAITWVGGRHVMVPDFDPPQVLNLIQEERVTISNMIPTMLNMLVNTEGVETYDFSSLRAILSGGASIAPEVVRKIMDVFKCDYIQTYGMTETSPYLTLSILKNHLEDLTPEKRFTYKAMTGRAFITVDLKVVRENGEDIQADGHEVGEIIVKGDTVTTGYWNRPEETEKAFKDGWLHTGDMAVINEEGYVNIVDRKKDMIITGGENVYSTEVENVLYEHPAVLEAAVIGVPDDHWGEAVKACVVLRSGQTVTENDVIDFCKKNIAHYKAPKTVDVLEELPKVGSGKIFKKGLRERYLKRGWHTFWIPAFAGMTGSIPLSSFPRRRESRSLFHNFLRCYGHFMKDNDILIQSCIF
ncbi:MAG: long-chain-fatty-acid--CoA ligase, partial [Deltaproteobacteria bacterium]|nr:long-chain-fatty-acid--CoA ligase [Deltaproteobacteria bacterium]